MECSLTILGIGILIFGIITIDNGLHILKYGKLKNQWRGPVSKPVKKSLGYVFLIAGVVPMPLTLWGLFNLATGKVSDNLVLVFGPMMGSLIWWGFILHVVGDIIHFSD